MSLRKSIIDIILNKGIDTKTDSKLTVGASLLGLENAVMRKTGKLEKRKGMDVIDSPFNNPKAVISSGDQLSVVDELNVLYGLNESSNQWNSKGTLLSSSASTQNIMTSTVYEGFKDQAEINGLHCLVWRDASNNIKLTLTDLTSDSIVVQEQVLDTSARGVVRVEVVQGQFVVVWLEGANVVQLTINPNNPLDLTNTSNIKTDATATYDILGTYSDGAFLYFVYNNTTPVAAVVKYSISGGIQSLVTLNNFLDFNADIIKTTVDNVSKLIVVGGGAISTEMRYAVLESNLSIETNVTTGLTASNQILNQTLVVDAAGALVIYYTVRDAVALQFPNIYKATLTFAGSFSDDGLWFKRAVLTAAAYRQGDSIHTPMQLFQTNQVSGSAGTKIQDTHFVLDENKELIAVFGSGEADVTYASFGLGIASLPHSLVVGDKTRLLLSEINSKVNLKTLNFAVQDTYSFVNVNNQSLISGGILYNYDGLQVTENGFVMFPEIADLNLTATGSSHTAGTYQYTAVFRWTDARGNKHQSATAIPQSILNATQKETEVLIPNLHLTDKSDVKIDLYRTEADGTLFYYLDTLDNDPANDEQTYTDAIADATLITGALLLISQNEVDAIVSQSMDKVVLHKDRVFTTGLQDRNLIRYSKQIRNNEGITFNEALEIKVEQLGGEITALQSMDNNLFIFKNERIYVVGGEPLDDFLNGTGFNSPELLSSDVGCVNSRSIVLSSTGIYFKSNKGIYLLNRNLSVSYIGDRVEDFNDRVITGAQLVEDQNEVRFSTVEGDTLVHNTYFDVWSTFSQQNSSDSATWKSRYVIIGSKGVTVEGDSYTDNGVTYSMKISTGWIATSGIQGFQRIYRTMLLGELESSHRLKIKVFNDYSDGAVQTNYINPNISFGNAYGVDSPYGTDIYGSDAAGIYQYGIHHKKQKCQAFRLEISDEILNDEMTSGQGFSLNTISVQIGTKRGFNKTNSTQQS